MKKPKQYFLSKIVLEAKYNYGYEFLDRCGSVINSILRENQAWTVQHVAPAGAEVSNLEDGTRLSFSSDRFIMGLTKSIEGEPLKKEDTDAFVRHLSSIPPIIMSELKIDIEDFKRIGSRIFLFIPFETAEDANNWIFSSGFFSFKKPDLFPGEFSNSSFFLKWRDEPINYAIKMDVLERNTQVDYGDSIISLRASALPKKQKETLLKQEKMRRRIIVGPNHLVSIDFDLSVEEENISREHLTGLAEICLSGHNEWMKVIME